MAEDGKWNYHRKGQEWEGSRTQLENRGFHTRNKVFVKEKTGNKIVWSVFNKDTMTKTGEMSFKSGSNFFRMFKANKTINRIKRTKNVSKKQAREIYQQNKKDIRENRIKNMMMIEGMGRKEAENYYSQLVRQGRYDIIKQYS
jgi:hypothetical protein